MFISFEGIDGAGKSSHIEPLAKLIRDSGREVVVTREPGGTELAEKLRAMVLNDDMDPMTEALLVFAARRDHIQKRIRPALAKGAFVLCDRFTDSTFAYQGYGRGFNHDVLTRLEQWVQSAHLSSAIDNAFIEPDLTFFYDLEPEIAARRLAGARAPDRFESEQQTFFQKVRMGYQNRMASSPERFVRVDASQSIDAVWNDVRKSMESFLGLMGTVERGEPARPSETL